MAARMKMRFSKVEDKIRIKYIGQWFNTYRREAIAGNGLRTQEDIWFFKIYLLKF
jgi:hypothetical protein